MDKTSIFARRRANSVRDELADFLPSALAIQERPPNPLASWVSRTLLMMTLLGVVWACVSEVDVVVSAEGKIVPIGLSKTVQSISQARVRQILVDDGDHVEEGQLLIELDNVVSESERNRIRAELDAVASDMKIAGALLHLIEESAGKWQAFGEQRPVLSTIGFDADGLDSNHLNLLEERWASIVFSRQALIRSLERTRAEQRISEESISKYERTVPIAARRLKMLEAMRGDGFASEIDLLGAQEALIEGEQSLAGERQRLRLLQASAGEVSANAEFAIAQVRTTLLSELDAKMRQHRSMSEELEKAESVESQSRILAPVSGTVQGLAVTTLGGVVTEAQYLMTIVPDSTAYRVMASLSNSDVGFVSPGMSVETKVHAFPFTKYGVLDSRINSLSAEATFVEQQGLMYDMTIELHNASFVIDGQRTSVSPGMQVTTDVRVGRRKLIEFVLTPLLRHRDEAFREI